MLDCCFFSTNGSFRSADRQTAVRQVAKGPSTKCKLQKKVILKKRKKINNNVSKKEGWIAQLAVMQETCVCFQRCAMN